MKISALMASQVSGTIVPRDFSIEEVYSFVAHAELTVDVDTGLTHLAAVLGKPKIEIYCDSPGWNTEGIGGAIPIIWGTLRVFRRQMRSCRPLRYS